jgi:hypothetical protein
VQVIHPNNQADLGERGIVVKRVLVELGLVTVIGVLIINVQRIRGRECVMRMQLRNLNVHLKLRIWKQSNLSLRIPSRGRYTTLFRSYGCIGLDGLTCITLVRTGKFQITALCIVLAIGNGICIL